MQIRASAALVLPHSEQVIALNFFSSVRVSIAVQLAMMRPRRHNHLRLASTESHDKNFVNDGLHYRMHDQ